jgi:colanic acid/amylovoran biosynthesis glycosyltransferase
LAPTILARTVRHLISHFGFNLRFLQGLYVALPVAIARPDVIHVEFSQIAVRCSELFLLGVPVIVSCRGSDILIAPRVEPDRGERLREVFARATFVHAVSQNLVDRAAPFGLDPAKAIVIRPSVALDRFPQTSRRQENGREPIRILTVGRVHWVKGYEIALGAIAELRARGLAVRYTIAGGGSKESLSALFLLRDELGLNDVVDVTGGVRREEVRAHLAKSDIYLLSSLSEGLSSAMLEGMATGLPVVATQVGGTAEALQEGVEGLLVPSRDPLAMAEALERLIKDAETRARMGRAARDRAEAQFSLEAEIDAFESLYRAAFRSFHGGAFDRGYA